MIHVVKSSEAKKRNSFGVAFQHELGAGDTYAIPENVEHRIEIIEDSEEVQVFTPPREDFR